MADVKVRVELSDKEIRDALHGVAKAAAGAGAGGSKVTIEPGDGGAGTYKAVVEFQRKAIEGP